MPPADVIFAAGGVLWRLGRNGPEVAVVHRPAHSDWGLPKGKLEPGERWQDAALREVREETGCEADLGEFAGVVCYRAGGRPKVVLFWNMAVNGPSRFVPGAEVDEIAWLAPKDAGRRLDHAGERELLAGQTPPEPTGRRHA